MEDLNLEETPGLCRDFLLAMPGGNHQVVHHQAAPAAPPSAPPPRARTRSVACGFPERRLRVTVRLETSGSAG